MRNGVVVAIDGPSGAGKSSVAKAAARMLGYLYIDTGAMYRAVTLVAIENQCVHDAEAIAALLPNLRLTMEPTDKAFRIFVNSCEVTNEIRSEAVNQAVSAVAAVPAVRHFLVEQQRAMAKDGAVILDGRDIASVVLPDAEVKIFLTADVKVRAYRRWLEMKAKGDSITLEEVEESLRRRDKLDQEREEAPLVRVPEATLLDASDMSFDEVVESLLQYIREQETASKE